MKLLLALLLAASAKHEWPGAEMPLQLSVRTAQDLEFKSVAERQYLIFNLLASGKQAWDQGDYATAAAQWESLLSVPGLDPEIEKVVRPFAEQARAKAGGKAGEAAVTPPAQREPVRREPPRRPATTTVEGMVSGGGAAGPGGAVITLKRTDGAMPALQPAKKVVLQRGKEFVPKVLAVAAGSAVVFRNDDQINHNVFSLSPHFDTGLYDPNASQPTRQKLTVPREGAKLTLTVAGDRQPPAYPPDKYGKPRQQQLGY